MSATPGPLKRWWKSPGVRNVRRRLSSVQVLLYPVLVLAFRLWVWLVQRRVAYDRRGPLYEYIREGKPCIITMWHEDVLPLLFELFRYAPRYPTMFMVSRGRVGTLGTTLLNPWGMECVAGSSAGSGEGIRATEELVRRQRENGKSIYILADGSRGPACKAKWGAVYMARDTGLPIIPARAWGNNFMTLEKTWMRLVLPKPWGRGVLLSGEPMYVPAGADKAELDACRLQLESRLNALVRAGDAHFAGDSAALDICGPVAPMP